MEQRFVLGQTNGNHHSKRRPMKMKQQSGSSSSSSRTGWMKEFQGSGADNFYDNAGVDLSKPTSHAVGSVQGVFKKGKHKRFSMAGSYFVAERGEITNSIGLNHEEAGKKFSKQSGIVPMKPSKIDRLEDHGSYIKSLVGCHSPGVFDLPMNEKAIGCVLSKSPANRTKWMQEERDAQLLDALGLEPTKIAHSDMSVGLTNLVKFSKPTNDRFSGYGSIYYR